MSESEEYSKQQRLIGAIYSAATTVIEITIIGDNLPLDTVQLSLNNLFKQRKQIANDYIDCVDDKTKDQLVRIFLYLNQNIREVLGLTEFHGGFEVSKFMPEKHKRNIDYYEGISWGECNPVNTDISEAVQSVIDMQREANNLRSDDTRIAENWIDGPFHKSKSNE